jgi:hypothetical protein
MDFEKTEFRDWGGFGLISSYYCSRLNGCLTLVSFFATLLNKKNNAFLMRLRRLTESFRRVREIDTLRKEVGIEIRGSFREEWIKQTSKEGTL